MYTLIHPTNSCSSILHHEIKKKLLLNQYIMEKYFVNDLLSILLQLTHSTL